MMHYLIYKALADERSNETAAAAKRRKRIESARYDSADASTSRPRSLGARLIAVLHVRRDVPASATAASDRGAIGHASATPARGGSRLTPMSGAGPIGCSA